MKKGVLFLIAGLLFSLHARAFPEMIRHGYVNCTSCHVSPSGGGILTEYGRNLSRDTLSTWGTENEAKFLYGAVSTPEWLNLGGDIRAIQSYLENQTVKEARTISMQNDLEAAVKIANVFFVGTYGWDDIKQKNLSRRHYILVPLTDQVNFRAGRFLSNYGLNIPDHVMFIRRPLGWDQGSETYNVELSWIGENANASLTGVLGRPDDTKLDREYGFITNLAVDLNEKSKLGVNFYQGSNKTQKRQMTGLYGMIGFSENLFWLTEFDFHQTETLQVPTEPVQGFVEFQKVGYEFYKGMVGFAVQQWRKSRLKEDNSAQDSYGLGLQLFPRPHFEFEFVWLKQRDLANNPPFYDYAWILGHYYL